MTGTAPDKNSCYPYSGPFGPGYCGPGGGGQPGPFGNPYNGPYCPGHCPYGPETGYGPFGPYGPWFEPYGPGCGPYGPGPGPYSPGCGSYQPFSNPGEKSALEANAGRGIGWGGCRSFEIFFLVILILLLFPDFFGFGLF